MPSAWMLVLTRISGSNNDQHLSCLKRLTNFVKQCDKPRHGFDEPAIETGGCTPHGPMTIMTILSCWDDCSTRQMPSVITSARPYQLGKTPLA